MPASSKSKRVIKGVTPQEALIYLMITTSAVDRVMSDVELELIGHVVRRLPAFEGFDKQRLVAIARECGGILSADGGLEKVLRLAQTAVPRDLWETAYALCVEVAAADKHVNVEEVRLLEILAERLSLGELFTAAVKYAAEARYRTV